MEGRPEVLWRDIELSGLICDETGVTEEGRRALKNAWRAHEDGVGEPAGNEPDPPSAE